jgi:hypothetical protein
MRRLIFSCTADNDLFRVAGENGLAVERFDTPAAAVEAAGAGDGVLLLADRYPDELLALDAGLFRAAAAKKLRLYVESASFLPGIDIGAPRRTPWERRSSRRTPSGLHWAGCASWPFRDAPLRRWRRKPRSSSSAASRASTPRYAG